nr:response regulator [Pseudomonas sp. NW5]
MQTCLTPLIGLTASLPAPLLASEPVMAAAVPLPLLLYGMLPGALLLLGGQHLLRFLRRPARDYRNLILALLGLLSAATSLWLPANLASSVLLLSLLASLLGLGAYLSHLQRRRHSEHLDASRAEDTNRAALAGKTTLLEELSHDMRTPLNGVLGMTELLLDTPLSERQRDYVQTIHSAGNELLVRLNELLDLNALSSGAEAPDDVQFDLQALIDECLNIFRAKAARQRLELIGSIDPRLPHHLSGDPGRLRHSLLNLLEQAFRQTREGEILLSASTDDTGQRLCLSVRDSGTPLDHTTRQAVLNTPLGRHNYLSGRRHEGPLGLLICRQLAVQMGGTFSIDSDAQGSTYRIDLPLRAAQREAWRPDLHQPLRDVRVLVVDDNPTSRTILLQQCSSWGMQATAAASGVEALALLRTKANLQDYFDVVLLDEAMPGMDGLQLAVRIQSDPLINQALPLIMLGSQAQPPGPVTLRNTGIARLLAKPVAGYALRATLIDVLGSQPFQPALPRAGTTPPAPLETLRVLVAEDNSISTKVICGMLAKLNVTPDTVENGEEALRALQRQRYDLVLMDCEMPVLDGFAATQRWRAEEQARGLPHTPIVALSAHILASHREQAQRAGMDEHLTKPVELTQLRRLIEHCLAQRALSLR